MAVSEMAAGEAGIERGAPTRPVRQWFGSRSKWFSNRLLMAGACSAGCMAAHAQSSVTLFGVVTAGVSYTSNAGGKSLVRETSGDLQGSHWGFVGSEPLSESTRAIFRLVNGFNTSTGAATQNNRLFGYESWVGLADRRAGTLTVGRQYDSVVDFLAPIHKPVVDNLAAHVFDNDNLNHGFRVNNAVKYSYGSMDTWKVSALYGFSNDAGAAANDRVASVGAAWNLGSVRVAAAWLRLDTDAGPANADGAVTLSDRTFVAQRQSIYGAGARWRAGRATVDALWTHSQFDHLQTINGIGSLGIATGDASAHFDNFELNAQYRFTAALSTTLALTYTAAQITSKAQTHRPNWFEPSLLVDYNLSKLTDVYASVLYQHAHDGGSGLTADINRQPLASGNTQMVIAAGLRERF
ncbi:porin [Burkholderia sp. 3C]